MIHLTEGGEFDEMELVNYIHESGQNYIIQGQQNVSQNDHTKANSLDFWLRPFGGNPDTTQADNLVLDALVDTGLFEIDMQLQCPITGERCKGIKIIET